MNNQDNNVTNNHYVLNNNSSNFAFSNSKSTKSSSNSNHSIGFEFNNNIIRENTNIENKNYLLKYINNYNDASDLNNCRYSHKLTLRKTNNFIKLNKFKTLIGAIKNYEKHLFNYNLRLKKAKEFISDFNTSLECNIDTNIRSNIHKKTFKLCVYNLNDTSNNFIDFKKFNICRMYEVIDNIDSDFIYTNIDENIIDNILSLALDKDITVRIIYDLILS